MTPKTAYRLRQYTKAQKRTLAKLPPTEHALTPLGNVSCLGKTHCYLIFRNGKIAHEGRKARHD